MRTYHVYPKIVSKIKEATFRHKTKTKVTTLDSFFRSGWIWQKITNTQMKKRHNVYFHNSLNERPFSLTP